MGLSPPSRPRRFGGQPSRGLPTVAHAFVGKRERRLERETGFEPATSTLARSHSTTELFPPSTKTQSTTAVSAQARNGAAHEGPPRSRHARSIRTHEQLDKGALRTRADHLDGRPRF